MTASQQTFGTAELLKKILLRFDVIELVQAGRVCRQWHECIKSSIHLQRTLFLEPMDENQAEYINWDGEMPLFFDDYAPGYPFLSKLPDTTSEPPRLRPGRIMSIHPVIEHFNDEDSRGERWIPYLVLGADDKKITKLCEGSELLFKSSRDGAWRKQLITQPPTTEAEFWIVYAEHSEVGDAQGEDWLGPNFELKEPDGITLGDIQDTFFDYAMARRQEEIERQRKARTGEDVDKWELDDEGNITSFLDVNQDATGMDTEEMISEKTPYVRLYSRPLRGYIWDGSPWVERAREDVAQAEVDACMKARKDAEKTGT